MINPYFAVRSCKENNISIVGAPKPSKVEEMSFVKVGLWSSISYMACLQSYKLLLELTAVVQFGSKTPKSRLWTENFQGISKKGVQLENSEEAPTFSQNQKCELSWDFRTPVNITQPLPSPLKLPQRSLNRKITLSFFTVRVPIKGIFLDLTLNWVAYFAKLSMSQKLGLCHLD